MLFLFSSENSVILDNRVIAIMGTSIPLYGVGITLLLTFLITFQAVLVMEIRLF